MNAVTWIAGLDEDEELHPWRWLCAVLFVVAAHAAFVAVYLYVKPETGITGADVPAVMIEFAPEAAAPETEADLAPGPETIDSQPTLQPEVTPQAAEEPVIEVPPAPALDPDIVVPPKKEVVEEKKQQVPQPKPPEPVEQPVQQQVQSVRQPTSNPNVEKRANKPVSPSAGTTAAKRAMVTYAHLLSAHLQRFKRPAKGRGTAVVSFTVNRSGRVVARRIVRSSGSSAVDDEAMAMIARAQPMPPFPAAVPQSEETFIQAIRFR
ncbi:MAG: TonB family protein [Pseudorhodoplanes sp.]|uniref:energy transducer TonB family protein n=1 Tax=Pseudorhodoplanes sp. TaxID=1934341 RepID=UPI003D0AD415